MNELKDLLLGILVVIYGLVMYIAGRTNIIENFFVRKMQDFVNDMSESEDTAEAEKKKDCSNCKNKNTKCCNFCVTSYNAPAPSHWQPKESEDTE